MRFGSYDDARYYFIDCILNDRPYWSDNPADPIMQTIMGSVSRMAALVALIRYFMETGVRAPRILEIGSFCGSSAVTMARALLRYHEGCGHITCIDPWAWTDRHPRLERNTWFDRNGKDIATYTYEDMFHHNVRSSGVADLITAHKGFSHDILPALGDAKFDLIYIDGDHSYEGVLGDLRRCTPLLAGNGILCGDDLDIQIPDLEEAKARQYTFSRAEHIRNWGRIGCPGITLALHEFFGRPITCVNGFFAQQKRDDGWQDLPWLKTAAPYSIDEVRKSLHSGPDLDIQRSPHPNLLAVSSLQLLIRSRFQLMRLKDGIGKIALYGANRHTRMLETLLGPCRSSEYPQIAAVIAREHEACTSFFGQSAIPIDDFDPSAVDAIVLSSDWEQHTMSRECRQQFGHKIRLVDLYTQLPPGPYPDQLPVLPQPESRTEALVTQLYLRSLLFSLIHQRVAIFGAGQHTRWLASLATGIPLNVVAVLDDNPPQQESFFQGIVPVRAEDWEPCDCDLIILSSDCSQAQMARRCRELYGNAIPLLDLYAGLPGPVAKYNMDDWN